LLPNLFQTQKAKNVPKFKKIVLTYWRKEKIKVFKEFEKAPKKPLKSIFFLLVFLKYIMAIFKHNLFNSFN